MSTLEKIYLDADRFARLYGLENEFTIKIYQIVERFEKYLTPDKESPILFAAWNRIYNRYERLVKCPE